MFRRFLARIFEYPHYKLIALLVAVGAWFYVQREQEHATQVRVELDWHLPAGLVAVDPLPTTAQLAIRGTRASTSRAQAAELTVPIDLSASAQGELTIDLSTYPVEHLPAGIAVLSVVPSSLRLTLDVEVERKVRVKPLIVGEPARGFRVEQVDVRPNLVTLRGARSELARLSQITTQPIDVSGVTASDVVPVALDVPRGLVTAERVDPTAELQVQSLLEQRTMLDVPVYVWGDPEGWQVAPSMIQVHLSGPSADIFGLTATDVVAFVHLPPEAKRPRYEVPFGARDDLHLAVLVHGGAEIEVLDVSPSRVVVERR